MSMSINGSDGISRIPNGHPQFKSAESAPQNLPSLDKRVNDLGNDPNAALGRSQVKCHKNNKTTSKITTTTIQATTLEMSPEMEERIMETIKQVQENQGGIENKMKFGDMVESKARERGVKNPAKVALMAEDEPFQFL